VSTHHREQKAYEARPDWAVCYPYRKRQEWMSDFCGVVSLSETGERYWLNIWEHQDNLTDARHFVLRLRAKEDPGAKTYSNQLHRSLFYPGQYVGTLLLANGQKLRVDLWEDCRPQTGRRYLRVHFELIGRRAEQ
jgi:hypothetical protein